MALNILVFCFSLLAIAFSYWLNGSVSGLAWLCFGFALRGLSRAIADQKADE